jgi:AraC-like DNA-binding protein
MHLPFSIDIHQTVCMILQNALASFQLVSVPHSAHQAQESFQNLPQTNTDLHLIHTLAGHGFMRIAGNRYQTDPSCVMCVEPHVQCLYDKTPGQPWEMINLHILLTPAGAIPKLPVQFTPANLPHIHRQLRSLHKLAASPDHLSQTKALAGALSLVTTYITSHGSFTTQPTQSDALISQIQQTLAAHAASPIDVDALASSVNLSRSQLTRRFKTQTGLSVKQYWTRSRLSTVQSLLRDTDLTLSQIAHQLHFTDVYYLSRWFTAHAGLSSTDYRKKSRSIPH